MLETLLLPTPNPHPFPCIALPCCGRMKNLFHDVAYRVALASSVVMMGGYWISSVSCLHDCCLCLWDPQSKEAPVVLVAVEGSSLPLLSHFKSLENRQGHCPLPPSPIYVWSVFKIMGWFSRVLCHVKCFLCAQVFQQWISSWYNCFRDCGIFGTKNYRA